MRRLANLPLLSVVLLPGAVSAQTVFFDDFQGPALAPHWIAPPPEHWDFNFNGGMLNVTNLLYPSHPHSSLNWADMFAHFPAQSDFRADIWIGWPQTPTGQQTGHHVGFYLLGSQGNGVAFVEYTNFGHLAPYPVIVAGTGTQGSTLPAPLPGINHFVITRTGGQFLFDVNGVTVAVFPDLSSRPATTVWMAFTGPFPGELAPLYVDRIQIVPCPGASTVGMGIVLLGSGRSRKRALPSRGTVPLHLCTGNGGVS
jgi:hypothetical protein